MASIRKREWQSKDGPKTAWILDYFDQVGKRHLKTFSTKKEADAYRTTALFEVKAGTHIADSSSKTVGEAGDAWLTEAETGDGETEPLERGTTKQYAEHLNLHIKPFLAGV